MKKTIALMLAAASFGVGSSAMAKEEINVTNALTQCGIGAIIAPTNETIAIVTNVTFDLGTTAVSSQMSSANTCNGAQKKMAQLIQNAYPQVTADIAKGQGERLEALTAAAQCGDVAGAQFKSQVRYEFGQLAVKANGKTQDQKNEDLFGAVNRSAVQAGCAI